MLTCSAEPMRIDRPATDGPANMDNSKRDAVYTM